MSQIYNSNWCRYLYGLKILAEARGCVRNPMSLESVNAPEGTQVLVRHITPSIIIFFARSNTCIEIIISGASLSLPFHTSTFFACFFLSFLPFFLSYPFLLSVFFFFVFFCFAFPILFSLST